MKSSKNDLRELYKYVERKTENPTIKKFIFDENTEKINYKPSYQRNFVWSIEKATKLIETILINGEIPPITVTRINNTIEIIDGRQRYQSILNFCNNKFRLKRSGLNRLPELEGYTYKALPDNAKEIIQSYKLRMIVYSFKFGVEYPIECEENLKRDLFRRYNSGMTSLSKVEVARASYAYDSLTKKFENEIKTKEEFYNNFINIFIAKTKRKLVSRELINLQLVTIRELLTLPYISIINNPSVKLGAEVIDTHYQNCVLKNNYDEIIQKFESIIKKIVTIKNKLIFSNNPIQDNILFYKAIYWMLSILYEYFPKSFYDFDENKFTHYIEEKTDTVEYFENYKSMTPNSIISRHEFMKQYLNNKLNISIDEYISKLKDESITFKRKPKKVLKDIKDWKGLANIQNILSRETTFEIQDITDRIKKGRFLIRPFYQREEIKNKNIASKIIESIILGIKLPPIYICSKVGEDGVPTFEVIDGQQRIISILSFIDEFINDCDGNLVKAKKGKFRLCNLRNCQFLNNKNCDEIGQTLLDKILHYELECIEIRENDSTDFKPVDMFLRLNSKPYPILYNSFEMWNSFDCVDILNSIKALSNKYSKDIFNQSSKKMKNEELITTLAYLDYKNINFNNFNNFFKVYVYFKDNEIKMTFDKKYSVTVLLENIEKNEKENEKFLNSIDKVEHFAEKIKVLFDEDYDKLNKILNPYKNIKKARAKDFYLLFLILQEFNMHIIKTYRLDIINDIESIYKYMKKIPNNIEATDFFNYCKKLISKYSNH